VACAAAANVVWIEDGAVCTPALACGVLDGIGRAQVRLACAELGVRFEETRAGPERLADLPMFLTNSLIGLRPVAALDGRPRPPSPLMAQLTHCFSRMRFRRICLRCALRPIDKG
jgi:branched-subunit amino acid aminotransferase/4-amino-4-deoxychorismate lyase